MAALKNCWEILQCGREANGRLVEELGECIVSAQQMGHSCWAVARSLCHLAHDAEEVQGKLNCLDCVVYQMYNRIAGTLKSDIKSCCPEEHERLKNVLIGNLQRLKLEK